MFCYGNDVPLTIASDFYHFCNVASSPFDHETLDYYYSYFQYHMYKHDMGRYYNMAAGKCMYINGVSTRLMKCYHNLPSRTWVLQPQAVSYLFALNYNTSHGM